MFGLTKYNSEVLNQNFMIEYLFTAYFDDEHIIEQNKEDKSILEKGMSSFRDVALYAQNHKLIKFELKRKNVAVSVDLIQGTFNMNGVDFIASPVQSFEENDLNFRLIYFREHTQNYESKTLNEQSHFVKYFIGWQLTVNGKNYQQLIGIQ